MKFYGIVSEGQAFPPREAYPDFVPNIIISFKHRQMVLYWDD